jgi:hypothetical protein
MRRKDPSKLRRGHKLETGVNSREQDTIKTHAPRADYDDQLRRTDRISIPEMLKFTSMITIKDL